VIKLRSKGWPEHVAQKRKIRHTKITKFQSGYLKGRNYFGDLSVDGRILLKWTEIW
jgi:hypothetical protein